MKQGVSHFIESPGGLIIILFLSMMTFAGAATAVEPMLGAAGRAIMDMQQEGQKRRKTESAGSGDELFDQPSGDELFDR